MNLLIHGDRMNENDKALRDQREQSLQLADQALMTMEKFMAMNKNNLEANEECLDLMAQDEYQCHK